MGSNDDEESREKEIRGIMTAIDDNAGPRTLVVLAVVSKDVLSQVKSRVSGAAGNVEVTTEDSLETTISSLAQSFSGRRLAAIFSQTHDFVSLRVPANFISLDIISVSQSNLHINSESTYCSIPLTAWNRRGSYHTHELIVRPHVYLEVSDYEMPSVEVPPPFRLADEDDASAAAAGIKTTMESPTPIPVTSKQASVLPWLAGAAGIGASLATGLSIVTNFEFGVWGAYVSCGPLVAAVGSVTGAGSLVAAGVATVGVGAAAAAAVYFIPWGKLAKWAAKAWDMFAVFVKSVWQFFKKAWNWFIRFLKMLIKAMRDFMTHLSNAAKWTGRLISSSLFSSANSTQNGSIRI